VLSLPDLIIELIKSLGTYSNTVIVLSVSSLTSVRGITLVGWAGMTSGTKVPLEGSSPLPTSAGAGISSTTAGVGISSSPNVIEGALLPTSTTTTGTDVFFPPLTTIFFLTGAEMAEMVELAEFISNFLAIYNNRIYFNSGNTLNNFWTKKNRFFLNFNFCIFFYYHYEKKLMIIKMMRSGESLPQRRQSRRVIYKLKIFFRLCNQ
jgi:hypothetical protein